MRAGGDAAAIYDPTPIAVAPATFESSYSANFAANSIDVTATVQAWADGTMPNYGFIIVPTAASSTGLGTAFTGPRDSNWCDLAHHLPRAPTLSHELPRSPTSSHDLPSSHMISHEHRRAPALPITCLTGACMQVEAAQDDHLDLDHAADAAVAADGALPGAAAAVAAAAGIAATAVAAWPTTADGAACRLCRIGALRRLRTNSKPNRTTSAPNRTTTPTPNHTHPHPTHTQPTPNHPNPLPCR